MIRIAICDDEPDIQDHLIREIEVYFDRQNISTDVVLFASGEDFLKSDASYDIVFMDIFLPGLSGIDTLNQYHTLEKSRLIFISNNRDFAFEAFELNAIHYLLKPLTRQAVFAALDRCLPTLLSAEENILELKTPHGNIPLPVKDIIYIDVLDKVSSVHTAKCDYTSYISLDALYQKLNSPDFLRVQRSFVVNMNFILSFFSDHVVLRGDIDVPLSRSNRSELKRQYEQFIFNMARRNVHDAVF